MNDQRLKDFVATYSRPKPPQPFFGFFKEQKYVPKTDRRPMYKRVITLRNRSHENEEIAEMLGITEHKVYLHIKYFEYKK